MDDLLNTDTWGTSWGDTTPVAPDNTSYDTTSSSQVYPDGQGGYTDINGNQTDASGNPISYDSNGNQVDSNGNIVNQAGTYQSSPQDQTTSPGSQQGQQQYGNQQQKQSNGLLGSLFGGSNNNSSDSSGSSLLGTLGGLALVGGAGYLLSQLLSNKSSGGAGTVNPVNIPQGNLQFTQLASPGANPGYAMGQPVVPAQPLPSSLTAAPNLSAIPTLNPQTLQASK